MKSDVIRLLIGLWFSLFVVVSNLMAQDETRSWSLVFFNNDSMVVYEPQTDEFRVVADRPDISMSLSPNSRYILYTPIVEFPDSNGYAGPRLTDIYMIDLATGETRLIAGQPDDATTHAQGIYRGNPIWSPDGNQVAWTERLDESELYIANLETGEIRLVADRVPSQTLASSTASITLWSQENGIMIEHVVYDENLLNPRTVSFDFYQTDGNLNAVQNPFDSYSNVLMLQTPDGERLAVNTGTGWFLIDPNSASEPQPLTSGIFGRTKSFAPDSLVVAPPQLHATQPATYEVYIADGTYLASLRVGDSVTNLNIRLVDDSQTLLLSRDGNELLFYGYNIGLFTLEIPEDLQVMPPAGYTTVLIPDDDVLYTSLYCEDNSLSMRLQVNNTAYVLPGDANNVRSSPDLSASRVGSIPSGAWFDVLDGPTCSGGYTWWQVDYLGTIGWTVEAGDGEYWLAPGCPPDGCVRG